MKFKKIGIFDSGVGGLSIAQELLKVPGLGLIYYADTANIPYGNRSKQEIQALSYEAITTLVSHDVDAIIIACHTVATNALDFLKEQFSTMIFIDVVDLIMQQVVALSPQECIGILGTQATIATKIHAHKIQAVLPQARIFLQACPQLASAIEYDFENRKYLFALVQEYTESLRAAHATTLILACTHYALIQELIQSVFDYEVRVISAEQSICQKLGPYQEFTRQTTVHYLSSGPMQTLERIVEKLMPALKTVQRQLHR